METPLLARVRGHLTTSSGHPIGSDAACECLREAASLLHDLGMLYLEQANGSETIPPSLYIWAIEGLVEAHLMEDAAAAIDSFMQLEPPGHFIARAQLARVQVLLATTKPETAEIVEELTKVGKAGNSSEPADYVNLRQNEYANVVYNASVLFFRVWYVFISFYFILSSSI